MAKPLFSVIIPTLNEEKFLPHLLDSLVAQSKKNFEVIVVDGKSKDKTVAVAKSYTDKLPKLRVLESKRSVSHQRNKGAIGAAGDWLVFVDADSILMPYFMARVARYIEEFAPQLFTTWSKPDTEEGADATMILFWNIVLESSVRIKRPLAPGPLTVVKKSAFELVHGYDENHVFTEDMDLSLRLFKEGIEMQMLRETLYILSLRRLRAQGTLKVAQQYIQGSLPVVFLKKTMTAMPGYITGGHLYGKKKVKRSVLAQYEKKLKQLAKELFG